MAENASEAELVARYRLIYGKDREIPLGSYQNGNEIDYDDDGGIERLRARLGSISRFVQELKQTFSRWFNAKHNRRGYLWGDRFKGVLVSKGDSMLACSAYIELNPVRAGIVDNPEKYRFSSMGLHVRSPYKFKQLISIMEIDNVRPKEYYSFYRQFVFETGGIKQAGNGNVSQKSLDKVRAARGRLGIGEKLQYRFANFSEGLAIGSEGFIADLQKKWGRRFIKPRAVLNPNAPPDEKSNLYATRQLNKA